MAGMYVNTSSIQGLYCNGAPCTAMYNGEQVWPTNTVRTLYVSSDSNNVSFTGALYNAEGTLLTSLTAAGNSASTIIPDGAVSARMTALADNYYVTNFGQTGGNSFTYEWARDRREGTGSVQIGTGDLELGSKDAALNVFTASGDFATDATARWGWGVPARVTYLNKPSGSLSEVTANKSYHRDVQTTVNSWGNYPVTQNGLFGTFSACEGWIKQTGNSYRRASYGNFGYWMRARSGPTELWNGTHGAGSYNSGRWADTTKTGTWSYSGEYTWGTNIDGSDRTISVAAQYGHSSIYTNTHGTWYMTGVAK